MKCAWILVVLAVLEWRGARCETDVDECAEQLVDCGPGTCHNLPGGYTCECAPGLCGERCSVVDPCFAEAGEGEGPGAGPAEGEGGAAGNRTGPCVRGACEQRCRNESDYVCHCPSGWGGKDCGEALVSRGGGARIALAVGGALLGALLLGGALALLGAQARRKRATRGTYSPSGQEYCNPRAEHVHHALKPPPEERLI